MLLCRRQHRGVTMALAFLDIKGKQNCGRIIVGPFQLLLLACQPLNLSDFMSIPSTVFVHLTR
jgi:hypothetical protein